MNRGIQTLSCYTDMKCHKLKLGRLWNKCLVRIFKLQKMMWNCHLNRLNIFKIWLKSHLPWGRTRFFHPSNFEGHRSLDKAWSLSLKFLLNTLLTEVLYQYPNNYITDVSRTSVAVTTSNTSLCHLVPSPFSIAKPQVSITPFIPPLGGHMGDQETVSRNFNNKSFFFINNFLLALKA